MQTRQTQPTHHPEAPDGKGWTHVAVKQEPAPPPIYVPPPALMPWLFFVGLLLGYSIAMGYRDLQLVQAKEQAAKSQAQVQALQQAKAAYCQGAVK